MAREAKNFRCNNCDDEWMCSTKTKLLNHYKTQHPDRPEGVWEAIGETWDATLTRIFQRAKDAECRVKEVEQSSQQLRKAYEDLQVRCNSLAGKLNAIQLILR